VEHGTPIIKAGIEGVERSLIVDTGSDVSILQSGISKASIRNNTLRPYGVSGETLEVKGRQTVSLRLDGRKFDHTFLVCPLPTEAAWLLGTDFLEGKGVHINFENGKMSFNDTVKDDRASDDELRQRRALTVFTSGKEAHSPQPMQRTEGRKDERVLANPQSEKPTSHSKTWLVKAHENILLAPRCKQITMARLEMEDQNLPPLVYVEPARIPIEGIFPSRTISRVNPSTRHSSQPKQSTDATVTRSANTAYVMLANFSEETLTVPKHTVLAIAQQISEKTINVINRENDPEIDKRKMGKRNEALYRKLLPGKLKHLSPEDRRHIEPILEKYVQLFHDENENDFNITNVIEHHIQLNCEKPIRKTPYRVPYALRQEMQD